MNSLLPFLLAAVAAAPPQDTTVAVSRGTRLSIAAHESGVRIDSWDRSAVRVVAEGRGAAAVRIRRAGSELRVEGRRSGEGEAIDFRITVPAWMDARVEAEDAPVSVRSGSGEIFVRNTSGDVAVQGGGAVQVTSVSGSVTVEGAHGRVDVQTVGQGIRLAAIHGDVQASTVNGSIVLEGIESASVEAETVNGSVTFDGPIQPSGYYRLASHNGPVTLRLSRPPNARISVSTYNGHFDSDFPLQLTSSDGHELSLLAGSGAARIELSSFNGTIALRRAGAR